MHKKAQNNNQKARQQKQQQKQQQILNKWVFTSYNISLSSARAVANTWGAPSPLLSITVFTKFLRKTTSTRTRQSSKMRE